MKRLITGLILVFLVLGTVACAESEMSVPESASDRFQGEGRAIPAPAAPPGIDIPYPTTTPMPTPTPAPSLKPAPTEKDME